MSRPRRYNVIAIVGAPFRLSGGAATVHRLLLTLIFLLAASGAAADTLHLANNGKVVGTITRITVKIGPLRRTLNRADIRSVKLSRRELVISDTDNTRYIGKLESVRIRSVASHIAFDGKSIRSINLDDEREAPVEGRPPALADVSTDEQTPADEPKPVTRKGKRVQALLQTAAALRNQYEKRSGEMAEAEVKAIRQKYAKAVAEARRNVESVRAKRRATGQNGAALKEAEAARDKVLRRVSSAKAAARKRAKKRRNRVRAYHDAISRYVATGRPIREKAMKGIFEKALAPEK